MVRDVTRTHYISTGVKYSELRVKVPYLPSLTLPIRSGSLVTSFFSYFHTFSGSKRVLLLLETHRLRLSTRPNSPLSTHPDRLPGVYILSTRLSGSYHPYPRSRLSDLPFVLTPYGVVPPRGSGRFFTPSRIRPCGVPSHYTRFRPRRVLGVVTRWVGVRRGVTV